MGFNGITIKKYIDIHLKNNPNTDRVALKTKIEKALSDFRNKIKCKCGDDIWVVGSAVMGNQCYTCITGETNPNNVYELEAALEKNIIEEDQVFYFKQGKNGEVGYFDADDNKLDPSKIIIPKKCLSCIYFNRPEKKIVCTVMRFTSVEGKEFKCKSYRKKEDEF